MSRVDNFIDQTTKLCAPTQVKKLLGTPAEHQELVEALLSTGTFTQLNQNLWPNSYACRTSPDDVARKDESVYFCTKSKDECGPTANWHDSALMKEKITKAFSGCMAGRTAYVIPFSMGPVGDSTSRYGIEITDSPYVALHMFITNRIGEPVLSHIENFDIPFFSCVHSLGAPLAPGSQDVAWPHNSDTKFLSYFPDEDSIWSFGSGYGGVSLLGGKWLGLQVATHDILTKKQPWIAQQAAVVGLTSPQNDTKYIVAILPSGKSSFAFQVPKLAGWTVRTISDNIAWLHVHDGKLYASNPEIGFVGIAPGTNFGNAHAALAALKKGNCIFTNVATTKDGDVWWEGKTSTPPPNLIDWTGKEWTAASGHPAAHPNARYAVAAKQVPTMDKNWQSSVPISAIVLGSRRSNDVDPLLREAYNWQHGIFLGATLASETTSKTEGPTGVLHRDPFAMNLYCSDMVGLWKQWDILGKALTEQPKMFFINVFQKDSSTGLHLWPGFGENTRLLKWMFDRVNGSSDAGLTIQTPIGILPDPKFFPALGLHLESKTLKTLLSVNKESWKDETSAIHKFFGTFGSELPKFLLAYLNNLEHSFSLGHNTPATTNQKLILWVASQAALFQPDDIFWVDGSKEENEQLNNLLVENGTFIRLNDKLRPNSFLARSTQDDVARVEERTYICCKTKEEAGITNNWVEPEEMKDKLHHLMKGAMKGRTMYVIPFCMGPLGSPLGKYGVQVTDSAYVVVNDYIMTRMGTPALNYITGDFVKCVHTVGAPLQPGQKDVPWPCNKDKYITHFPEENLIMSYGSGYGGNALLGKKCFALRIGSYLAKKEGWMAEHCLIMSLESPEGKKYYIAAAFPSACGKTNLAMLVPTLPGWTVKTLGDDIAWMRPGADGRLYAINPENGFFGVAPGTSELSNQNALTAMSKNSIFTNVALTREGDVWWEEKTPKAPAHLIDWTNQEWTPDCGRKSSHPNSRYTVPCSQNPVLDPDWEKVTGVPIDAILFGGRRPSLVPLVSESFSWKHGVFQGSLCSSETTAAAAGAVGVVRRDPFAMIPFCGYNMAHYWQHWLDIGKVCGDNAPKIFYVNWFRKRDGKWLWPGFGENSRVLKWICERCDGTAAAIQTPVGLCPAPGAINVDGLDVTPEVMEHLTTVDKSAEGWKQEIEDCKAYYAKFGSDVPADLNEELAQWVKRLTE